MTRWADLTVPKEPIWGLIPGAMLGVVRLDGDRPCVKTWTPTGEHTGYCNAEYSGPAVVLADEVGALYLRGVLPAEARPMSDYAAWAGVVDTVPYTGPLAVLVVEGVQSFAKAAAWAVKRETVQRYGAMPVIGYIGKPAVLGGISWRAGDRVVVTRQSRADAIESAIWGIPVEVLS